MKSISLSYVGSKSSSSVLIDRSHIKTCMHPKDVLQWNYNYGRVRFFLALIWEVFDNDLCFGNVEAEEVGRHPFRD